MSPHKIRDLSIVQLKWILISCDTSENTILSSNKKMMQLHFKKKVIVLLAAQRNLESLPVILSGMVSIRFQ